MSEAKMRPLNEFERGVLKLLMLILRLVSDRLILSFGELAEVRDSIESLCRNPEAVPKEKT